MLRQREKPFFFHRASFLVPRPVSLAMHGSRHAQLALKRKCFYASRSRSIDPRIFHPFRFCHRLGLRIGVDPRYKFIFLSRNRALGKIHSEAWKSGSQGRGKRLLGRSGCPFMYPMHSQSAVIKLAIPCGDIISLPGDPFSLVARFFSQNHPPRSPPCV